jgi:hypothetical protein
VIAGSIVDAVKRHHAMFVVFLIFSIALQTVPLHFLRLLLSARRTFSSIPCILCLRSSSLCAVGGLRRLTGSKGLRNAFKKGDIGNVLNTAFLQISISQSRREDSQLAVLHHTENEDT